MTSKEQIKQIYFNDAQRKVMHRQCNTEVIVGGRRLGKSHGIAQPFEQRNIQRMPRGTHGIIASTFQQAFTRTLPGTLEAFEKIGFKRNMHYVIGRRPEPSLNFEKPFTEPAKYENIISWYNGSIMPIISQDVPGSSNSMTFDSLLIDEAKFIDFEKLNNETIPANGGTTAHFGHLPWHHSMMIISDMPTTKKGSWFLKFEDKCDNELIANIDGIIFEKWRIIEKLKEFHAKGIQPKKYIFDYYKSLCKSLAEFQKIAIDYNVFSSIENLQVLGPNYIKQMKRDLPPLVFQTSILCKRVGLLKDGFYNCMKEADHYYTAFDNSYLQNLDYDFSKAKNMTCLQDADVDKNAPICVAFDYNGKINWLVGGQRSGLRMKTLKSFFVKYDRKLVELVNDFCKYYEPHKCHEVIYYYDSTALNSNYAVNDKDFAAVIIDTFKANKWIVKPVYIGKPVGHMEKHNLINMSFKGQSFDGKQLLFPMINKNNNEPLILAMEQTGIYQGPDGFKKDKRGEKLDESEEDLLENRTDGTDAWDTLWIGMNNFPHEHSFSGGLISSFV